MPGLRGLAADMLEKVGLSAAAFGLYQRLTALRAPAAPGLPPAYLRVLTAGTAHPLVYLGVGGNVSLEIIALARRHGATLEAGQRVLDFGCGCGRIAAPLGASVPAALSGCDVNPELIAWCEANIPGDFRVTQPAPPLPYDDGAFTLVYALSVFTHLHEANARAWLAELARVTRPGGLAILSLFDEDIPAAAAFRAELLDRGFLIRREGPEGSNLLCAYISRAGFTARAAPAWRLLQFIPATEGASGQTLAVLQRA
jgi:SAM-dependent methyltransferase